MANVSFFSAGTLTIPAFLNYVGEFTLINNSGQNIDKIVNLPTNHKTSKFKVEAGNTQTFSHTAIGSSVADNLVSDAATTNSIIGRANGSDVIEYEKSGTLNLRTNIVKLS